MIFFQLQELQGNSGFTMMKYLQEKSLSYSTYNYWKRKFLYQESEEPEVPFAQVCIRPSTEVALPSSIGHNTLLFLNGVHVCLDANLEEYSGVYPHRINKNH